jgi:hypothetical protein
MFGLTGIWFTIVALLSPSSSVSLRTPSDRRGRTDFRTNTEVAEEGRSRALESELSGGRGFGRKKKREPRGSISDNAAAKERARMRAKSGSSSRSAEARKLSVGSDPGAHVKSTHGRSSNQSHGHHNSFQDRGQGGRKGSDEMDVKVMDFAQSEDDIPLQTRNTSTPRLYQNRGDPEETVQPVPTRRTSFSRVLRPTPGQGRDDHPDITPGPSSPGSVKSRRKGKEPMDSPSPPRMSSPSREQDAEARQRGPRHRPSSRNQSRFSNPFRSSSSNTAEDDPDNLRPFQSLHSTTQATKTYGRHQRRPAPIWLSFLPLPFFLLWGVTTALIMSTIIGFTLSAVYNTVGFEMSTLVHISVDNAASGS